MEETPQHLAPQAESVRQSAARLERWVRTALAAVASGLARRGE
jgi:hypothetical protein